MAELVSLWVARGIKDEKDLRERENKTNGLVSDGFDLSTDSGAPTIRDPGEYSHNIDADIIVGFIKRRSPPNSFTKGSKVAIKTTRALITHDEGTRNENKMTQLPQFFEVGWEELGSNSGYSFKIKREKLTFEP